MLPYGRQSINESDIEAVTAVLRGDWLTTGPTVDAFEHALESFTGATRCVTATSGTAALHMAYAAAGVGPGDEVVTTPMTFVATASSAVALGAKIVFADVDPETALLDPQAVREVVTDRTKVIAAVDYAGVPADLDSLNKIAHRHGALTVQDAAHSIGSTDRGRQVGTIADLTTFSFFPTKNMTSAEGGAVATMNTSLGKRAHRFHFIGLVRDHDEMRYPDEGPWHQEVHEWGLNYRLPDVLCALGLNQLKRLADFRARRARLVERYDAGLGELAGLGLPGRRPDTDPTWHLYPVRVRDGRRREVFDRLRAQGIGVQVNYMPVHWHPMFEDLGWRRGMFPHAEDFYREELSLPMFADLTDGDQDRVIEALRSILGS